MWLQSNTIEPVSVLLISISHNAQLMCLCKNSHICLNCPTHNPFIPIYVCTYHTCMHKLYCHPKICFEGIKSIKLKQ